jgi:hypothetical protein
MVVPFGLVVPKYLVFQRQLVFQERRIDSTTLPYVFCGNFYSFLIYKIPTVSIKKK